MALASWRQIILRPSYSLQLYTLQLKCDGKKRQRGRGSVYWEAPRRDVLVVSQSYYIESLFQPAEASK
jgi:hypothetical protein